MMQKQIIRPCIFQQEMLVKIEERKNTDFHLNLIK